MSHAATVKGKPSTLCKFSLNTHNNTNMVQVNLYQYMFPKTNENISQTNLITLVKATQKKIHSDVTRALSRQASSNAHTVYLIKKKLAYF